MIYVLVHILWLYFRLNHILLKLNLSVNRLQRKFVLLQYRQRRPVWAMSSQSIWTYNLKLKYCNIDIT